VTVLDEIPCESFGNGSVEDLTRRVHALFARHLDEGARDGPALARIP
jgi:hypothetical protein